LAISRRLNNDSRLCEGSYDSTIDMSHNRTETSYGYEQGSRL
jgi:hypothetical protein